MKKQITIFLVSSLLLLGACKKEECPEPEVYYTSIMNGKVFNEIRVELKYHPTGGEQWCEGWFISEIYQSSVDFSFSSSYKTQVVEGLPDSIKTGNNYFGKDYLINVEFIGVGYECKYFEELSDHGVNPMNRDVELVKITKIEEAP